MPFTDVAAGSYYYDAVLWAVEKGITNGMGGNIFGVNATCTRAQMITFIWRAAGSMKFDNVTVNSPYTDVSKDGYYYDALIWALLNSITNGTSATTFGPDDLCTRAQALTMLYRYMGR
jgi:hypothetical protein